MALATAPQSKAKAGDHKATAAAVAVNPFTRASKRKTETFLDVTRVLSASSQTLNQVDIPATGYLRHVVLNVTCTGITDADTLKADAPWSLLDRLTFRDVNGQPLHVLSGFDLFLANLFGAYTQNADPRKTYGYSASTTGNEINFSLRVPIEIIARGALGCLDNTNGQMLYKLAIDLAPIASTFVGETGTPTVRITAVAESWSNPAPADVHGVPNETKPPAMGTTQNWSEQVVPLVNGQNTIRLARVGNAIRNLVLVARDSTGARADNLFPSDLAIYFDGNQWHKAPTDYFRRRMVELYGYAPADLPAGVIVLPFTDDFDGTPGEEMGDFWVQTSGATRAEIQASFPAGAAGGSLMILTNDVLAVAAPSGPGQTLGS